MTCFHPLVLEQNLRKFNPDTGKPISRVIRKDVDPLNVVGDYHLGYRYITIPCGRCIGCRIAKSKEWAVRIMCETITSSKPSYFVTLTYDDEHLPSDLNLHKSDLQDFIKAVRNYWSYKYDASSIRYFGCGEYGSLNGRCHFHVILFNIDIPDLVPFKTSKGNTLFKSETILSLWDKGFADIGRVEPESAAYVARYTLKKQSSDFYDREDIEPPFILMSTRPGIGFDYYQQNKDSIWRDRRIQLGYLQASIPKYFIKLFEKDDYPIGVYREEVHDRSFDSMFMKWLQNSKAYHNYYDLLQSEELHKNKEMDGSRDV